LPAASFSPIAARGEPRHVGAIPVRNQLRLIYVACGLVLALSHALSASAPRARLIAVMNTLRENAEALRGFEWKARTEIKVEGELRELRLVRVSYPEEGLAAETPIPIDTASTDRLRKLRKKFRAFYDELQALTRSYVELEPQKIERALEGAYAWEGQGEQGDRLHIQARSVIRKGDKLDLWIDDATNHPLRLEVLTSLEGEGVRLTTEFRRLEDGPSYAAWTRVESELKEKKLVARTEQFEVARRGD
jgi:hypothetical protein